MRNIILTLKRYKLKDVQTYGVACPGGGPYRPVHKL